MYFLNPYAIPSFTVAVLALIFGIFVQRIERKSRFNRALLCLYTSAAFWLTGCGMIICSRSVEAAYFWTHIFFAGLILTAAGLFYLATTLTEEGPVQRYRIGILYAMASGMFLLTFHPQFLSGIRLYPFGYYFQAGEMQFILILFVALCCILSFLNIFHRHARQVDEAEKTKLRFFLLAFLALSSSFIDLAAGYNLIFYPVGYFAVLGFVVSITCYKAKYYYAQIARRAENLEEENIAKAREITKIIEELRTTQLKLLETGKVSALASLSAGILHQISQPITAIHGFVKFLKKEMPSDSPFYKPIQLMEEQSVYLKEMLEDLMELIRHREIRKERTNVNDSIQRAANLLNDELRIRRVEWNLALDENLPDVYADAVHLQQIFMNIIINAIQAMSELGRGSKRQLMISSYASDDREEVLVSFKDTGPGLSVEDQKQIFEPFFSTKTTGTGIGLALCKDLVAEHGGTIEVDSTPGAGVIFTIRLPSADSQAVQNLRVQRI